MGKSGGEEIGKTIIYSSVEANYQKKISWHQGGPGF